MASWGELKKYIKSAILKGDVGESDVSRFPDDSMIMWARWACAEISMHTAEMKTYSFLVDGSKRYLLPSNRIGDLSKTTLLRYSERGKEYIGLPYRRMPSQPQAAPSSDVARAYWEWPSGYVTLTFAPIVEVDKLELDYFGIWSAPTHDDFELHFPDWLEHPFCYLVAARAMDPQATQASMIRQWNTRLDSGNPEDNTLIQHARYLIGQAYRLLNQQPTQERDNFWKNDPRRP